VEQRIGIPKTGIVDEKKVADQSVSALTEVQLKQPKSPKDLSSEEQQNLQAEAKNVVAQLETMEGGQAMDFAERVSNVGIEPQRNAGADLEIFQTRMGKITSGKDENSMQVEQSVERLKSALNKINPKSVEKEFLFNLLSIVPFLGNRMVRILKTIDGRRETVESFIEYMGKSIEKGRDDHDREVIFAHDQFLIYEILDSPRETVDSPGAEQ